MDTAKFSEYAELLAHIPADSETTEQNTGWISAGGHHRFVVLISVGDMGTNATFDVDIEQAQDSDGTGVKDVSSPDLSITQLDESDGDGNQAIIINFRSAQLDVANGFDYFRVECTPATAAVEFSVMVFGVEPRHAPVSTTNVEEVVN